MYVLICQWLYYTILFFKILYYKIKNVFIIFVWFSCMYCFVESIEMDQNPMVLASRVLCLPFVLVKE